MDTFQLDGFRPWLERATRIEDEIDWSVHTVDYATFKRRLLDFSKRRSKLRTMVRNSLDGHVTKNEVIEVLGPPPAMPPNFVASIGGRDQNNGLLLPSTLKTSDEIPGVDSTITLGYVPFVESASSKSNKLLCSGIADAQMELEMADAAQKAYDNLHYNRAVCGDIAASSSSGGESGIGINANTDNHGDVPPVLTIGDKKKHGRRDRPLKHRSVMRRISNAERHEVVVFLAWEVDKVAMFYLAQWQRLSQMMVDFNARYYQQQHQSLQFGEVAATDPSIVTLGEEILELLAFCVINIVTVRQMLIRYDAFARSFEGTPMLHYYMKRIKSFKGQTSFLKILHHEELKALADSFSFMSKGNIELSTQFDAQRRQFESVLENSKRAETLASSGHVEVHDNLLQSLRHYFMLGLIEDRLGYEPAYLLSRGRSLSAEMKILADWRNRGDGTLYKMRQQEEESQLSRKEIFNLVMALLAGFLYCVNYYIVEPSSALYVNALGAGDYMSAALIGMMPLASFISSIGFSMWTNHSFRHPFLLSALLMLVGNILYSVAFNFHSIYLALAGRFLTGLGGPKCIIRRYMADTTSLNLRTSVNAGFGMVVAAGSAFGPGCAVLLNKLNCAIRVPTIGEGPEKIEIPLNGLTGPGYFMAAMWTIFLLALTLNFEEPDRAGLEEQKRLEKETATAASLRTSLSNDVIPSPSASPNKETINRCNYERAAPSEIASQVPGVATSVDFEKSTRDDDLMTIFSGSQSFYHEALLESEPPSNSTWLSELKRVNSLVTFPVRICLGLLFAKVFVIEALVSSTSVLSKNRYDWHVEQVGTLGCVNGLTVIPLAVMVGRFSMSYQDRFLMAWLLSIGIFGLFLLIDVADLVDSEAPHYNQGNVFAVHTPRYVMGYFLVYMSIQSFEGVIGSALSKVIPTALAVGTFNSGLLATLVDTLGRACGDLFICLAAFINLRQLMNLLFIPAGTILVTCFVVVRRHYDVLAV